MQDRHLCTIAGCLLSYGYTAAAWHLARSGSTLQSVLYWCCSEGHACFKAITGGIIDGRAGAYLPIGWGVPMIALGYNIHTRLTDFGDDPACFVGWSNVVKWQVCTVALTIVQCNIYMLDCSSSCRCSPGRGWRCWLCWWSSATSPRPPSGRAACWRNSARSLQGWWS